MTYTFPSCAYVLYHDGAGIGEGGKAPLILNVYTRRQLFKFLPMTLSTREKIPLDCGLGRSEQGWKVRIYPADSRAHRSLCHSAAAAATKRNNNNNNNNELTEGGIVQFILVHLSPQCPQLSQFQFLCLDSIPEPSQSLVLRGHLVVPRLLLLQKAQALFLGHQQLVLRVDLVLLPAGHLLKLP